MIESLSRLFLGCFRHIFDVDNLFRSIFKNMPLDDEPDTQGIIVEAPPIIKTVLPDGYVYPSLDAYKKEDEAKWLRENRNRRYFLRERAMRPQLSAEVKSLIIQI